MSHEVHGGAGNASVAGSAGGGGVSEQEFRDAVERLRVPGMGTEVVAPLLSHLIQMVRPRRVLEVGMGYTTPFLARTLQQIEATVEAESAALVRKSVPYLRDGQEFDEDWIQADPALLVPGFYRSAYRPVFAAVDDLSDEYSSAPLCQQVLAELGLADRVTLVNADMRKCRDLLPAELLPIDFAWVDAWECLYFFEHFWDLINPDGGMVVMHYLMSYPEGEAVLEYIADSQRLRPGEFEVLSLLESQKIRQNSLTVIRKTSGWAPREYSGLGQQPRLGGEFRADAAALAGAAGALPRGAGSNGSRNGSGVNGVNGVRVNRVGGDAAGGAGSP